MKQTLIQIIVAVAALAALAAVVYRAQSTAPVPADDPPITLEKPSLTHEPVFLPSTKTDAGAGIRLTDEPGTVGEKDPRLPQAPEDEPEDEQVEPQQVDLEGVEVQLSNEIFLPSTKYGPIIPNREEEGE